MSFDTRARREAAQAHASVRGVNPMVRLDELKREVKTRRRTGAVLTAVVVAVVVVGASWLAASRLGGSNDSIAPPAQTPAPTPTTSQPQAGALQPGRYAIPIHGGPGLHAEVTIPESGWEYGQWNEVTSPEHGGIFFWIIGTVYSDACDGGGVQLPAGHTRDQLIAALDAQQGTRLSTPTDVVIGGHPGVRIDLIESPNVPSSCNLWADPSGFTRAAHLEAANPLWIVDVDGTTVLIDAQTNELDAATEAIIDNVTFANH